MVKYKVNYSGKYGKDGLGSIQPIVYCPECGQEIKLQKGSVNCVHEKRTFIVKEFYECKRICCLECGCQFEAAENIFSKLRWWVISGFVGLVLVIGLILLAIYCKSIEYNGLAGISGGVAVIAATWTFLITIMISEEKNG